MPAIAHEVVVKGSEPRHQEDGSPSTSMLPYFAAEASKERVHPGLGVLYGLLLGGGMWAGILALVGIFRR